MKQRITIFLEEQPAKMLRVMAASENTDMSTIVTEFILGKRRIEEVEE